jgi:histone deacetylase 1/2
MYRGRLSVNTLVLAETKKKEEMNWTNDLLVSIFLFYVNHKSTLTFFKKYIELARYVYNLQDTDTTTEDSEASDSWDSDESSGSQNNWRRGPYRSSSASRINGRYTQHQPQYTSTAERKRMSLITGKYYDIPINENGFSHFDGSTSIGKQPNTKRRFFPDEPGKWDDVGVCVVDASVNARMVGGNVVGVGEGFGNGYGYAMVPELARIMERGGGGLDGYGEDGEPDEGEDDDEDVPMST